MLAYMSSESLEKTLESGTTWFFSRSRNKLWNKGATSGNIQKVKIGIYKVNNTKLRYVFRKKQEVYNMNFKSYIF